MKTSVFIHLARLATLCFIILCSPVIAGQWKPLCIEGSSCNAPKRGYLPFDQHAVGPLVTNEGIMLQHTPFELPILDSSKTPVRHVFQLSSSGLNDLGDMGGGWVFTDANAIQSPTGRVLAFSLGVGLAWVSTDEDTEGIFWFVNPANYSHCPDCNMTGPPVVVNNVIYIGLSSHSIERGGGQLIYMSEDDGKTWARQMANISISGNLGFLGSGRYNLMKTPEGNALWGIHMELLDSEGNIFGSTPGSLWESEDHGANWQQVDDGSFPPLTVRVVHDPANALVSYALTTTGLFISVNRGVSWQATSMTEPVHGLVFVDRFEPLSRALIVGTDTGINVSVDETASWLDMSSGLLEIPHTVTYGHGQLIATSDAGYFTCNTVDCAGLSQVLAPEEERGIVEVIEFYNTDLGHYFMTAMQEEVDLIEQGLAGAGWIQTGESFLAWNLGATVEAANVCRFYGSMQPGPNSHFYTLSTQDCSFLMHLQETQPVTEPRWNFEGYAFSIMPPMQDEQEACSEGFIPVYRAYNNGFIQGKDSNHRYVTDLDLITPMIDEGWTDEGVAFCSPAE
jgi:hypothetical protein